MGTWSQLSALLAAVPWGHNLLILLTILGTTIRFSLSQGSGTVELLEGKVRVDAPAAGFQPFLWEPGQSLLVSRNVPPVRVFRGAPADLQPAVGQPQSAFPVDRNVPGIPTPTGASISAMTVASAPAPGVFPTKQNSSGQTLPGKTYATETPDANKVEDPTPEAVDPMSALENF